VVAKPIDSNTKGEFILGFYLRSTALFGLTDSIKKRQSQMDSALD